MNKKLTWRTYFYKGKEEFELSNYKSAIKSFKNALDKKTKNKNNNCLTILYLASTYYFLNDLENAIYFFKIAFRKKYNLNNQIWDLINYIKTKKVNKKKLKDLNKFLKIFESLIKKYWGHSLLGENPTDWLKDIYWMRAGIHKILGNNKCALTFYSKTISLNKHLFEIDIEEKPFASEKYDFCNLLRERASTYISIKRYKEAIDDINNSILIEKLPEAYFCAGIIYRNLQNYNLSISMFSEGIKLMPLGDVLMHAHINRGFCRVKNENIEEAINDFENALSFDENCLKEYPNIVKAIPETIKNIIRINLLIKI